VSISILGTTSKAISRIAGLENCSVGMFLKMGPSVEDGDRFTVEGVDADDFGGAVLALSGGYRIVIFPAGSTGEDWRLFRRSSRPHFVIAGGRIERTPDETG
jgi:hypothetical protein